MLLGERFNPATGSGQALRARLFRPSAALSGLAARYPSTASPVLSLPKGPCCLAGSQTKLHEFFGMNILGEIVHQEGKKKILAVHLLSNVTAEEVITRDLKIRQIHDTDRIVYRCFLPDLTGFTTVCCAGSNLVPRRRPSSTAYCPPEGLRSR